ncbi:hypothetical protein QJQ45_027084, partial [Haematococcus lacustris]
FPGGFQIQGPSFAGIGEAADRHLDTSQQHTEQRSLAGTLRLLLWPLNSRLADWQRYSCKQQRAAQQSVAVSGPIGLYRMPAHDAPAFTGGASWQNDVLLDITGAAAPGAARIQMNHSSGVFGSHGASAPKATTQYSTYCQERGIGGHSGAAIMQKIGLQARSTVDLENSSRSAPAASTVPKAAANVDLHDVMLHAAANVSKQTHNTSAAAAARGGGVRCGCCCLATGSSTVAAAAANANALYQRQYGAALKAAGAVSKDQVMQLTGNAMHHAIANLKYHGKGAAQEAMQLSPEYHGRGLGHSSLGASEGGSQGGTQGASCDSTHSTTAYLDCEEMGDAPGDHNQAAYARAGRARREYPDGWLYVYMPTLFTDHTSPVALNQANEIMMRLTIPGKQSTHLSTQLMLDWCHIAQGDVTYLPVPYDSKLYQLGSRFGFTAFSITLGSSYFQRLLATMPHLEYAVRCSGPAYADYLSCLPPCSDRRLALLHEQFKSQYSSAGEVTEDSTLRSIQFTCVYLATKIVDRMPMLEMLRYILTYLYGSTVSKAQAYDVESKCLEGLNFRLGPYFVSDDLSDEDWPYGCT